VPRSSRPAPNCQTSDQHNCHRHQESIKDVQEKGGAKWHKTQAGRPHFAASRAQLGMEVTSTNEVASKLSINLSTNLQEL
jgi:hypothetical protein